MPLTAEQLDNIDLSTIHSLEDLDRLAFGDAPMGLSDADQERMEQWCREYVERHRGVVEDRGQGRSHPRRHHRRKVKGDLREAQAMGIIPVLTLLQVIYYALRILWLLFYM